MYNLIGNVQIITGKMDQSDLINTTPYIKNILSTFIRFSSETNISNKTKQLRDDQICLLVWTAKVVGLTIQEVMGRENSCIPKLNLNNNIDW